jgi:hypothetical protein
MPTNDQRSVVSQISPAIDDSVRTYHRQDRRRPRDVRDAELQRLFSLRSRPDSIRVGNQAMSGDISTLWPVITLRSTSKSESWRIATFASLRCMFIKTKQPSEAFETHFEDPVEAWL